MTYEIELMQETFDDFGLTVKQVNVVGPDDDDDDNDNNQITVIAEITADQHLKDSVNIKVNAYDAEGKILAVEDVGRVDRDDFRGYDAVQTNIYDSRVVENVEKLMLYVVKY